MEGFVLYQQKWRCSVVNDVTLICICENIAMAMVKIKLLRNMNGNVYSGWDNVTSESVIFGTL